MSGESKKLNDRINSVDQNFMDGISNIGGYIMGGLKNFLPDNPYEKNEESGEVVVKKSKQELQALENQAKEEKSKSVATPVDGVNKGMSLKDYQQKLGKQSPLVSFMPPPPPPPTEAGGDNSTSTANNTNSVYSSPGSLYKNVNTNSRFDSQEETNNKNIMLDPESFTSDGSKITSDTVKETGKQISNLFTKSDNSFSKSKSRMGLFGNYGKDVTIKKTLDTNTGRVNKQKFVDGEEVKNRNENKNFNKAKRVSRVGKGIVGRNK
jgi:hypothetical protein